MTHALQLRTSFPVFFGLTADRDFEQVILEKAGDGPRLVLEGKVAALWGTGIGWP